MKLATAVWDRCRRLPPRAILALGWVVALVYAYPGVMTIDSSDQLNEARANFYTDSHPPIMAVVWRYVDAIVPGPFGMWVIQSVAFVAGLYWLLVRDLAPRRAAVATVAIFLFPPVLAPMAVIWKDSLMAGMFLLGLAGVLRESRRARAAGLAALWFATALRYNAFAAAAPLVVLLFAWSYAATWRRYALAIGAWLAITVAAIGANAVITDQPMHFWYSSLAVFDICGTLAHVDGTIPDDELRQTFAGTDLLVDHDIHAAIRARYEPWNNDPIVGGDGRLWALPINGTVPAPEAQRDAVGRAFWDVVTAHEGAYLAHRVAVTEELLGIHTHSIGKIVRMHDSQSVGHLLNEHLATGWSPVQGALAAGVRWLARHGPLFRPWLYLVLSLGMLWPARRHRDVAALLLSGIGLAASLFFLAPSPDYRYLHWMVVCTVISAVILAARRPRTRKLGDNTQPRS
ncbi:MAG TPA: hypothetical protein VMJ10_37760 [Kofleriaceae bacterium]|nr:hypothetical protein [Kofleriaceae bacterium]